MPLVCGAGGTVKEKCTTTTRTTTTISEKIDSAGNCTTTSTSTTGADGVDINVSNGGNPSGRERSHNCAGSTGSGVNVSTPVGDYRSIVDVNVVTDAAGRTVTNIKTSVCATPKCRDSPQVGRSAKAEKVSR